MLDFRLFKIVKFQDGTFGFKSKQGRNFVDVGDFKHCWDKSSQFFKDCKMEKKDLKANFQKAFGRRLK